MSTQVQLRRGTTAQHATFTGALAEVTVDTDKKILVVHDGATAGGFPVEPAKNAIESAADRTALKALSTAKASVYVLEAGREGIFKWDASDLSTEVTADTQEGIYIAPSSDTTGASGAWVRTLGSVVAPVASPAIRTIGSRLWDRADLRDWNGLDLTGANDCTSLVNAALAESGVNTLWQPAGTIALTDMVTIPNDKKLIGEGVGKSVFSITPAFNMSAAGVVKMGTSENSGLIDEIGFEFEQPATGVRADMNQYPPAINHNNIPRVRIGHIRISAGWDGIDGGGNSGGAKYGFIECGTLNRGLLIDGALDTVDVGYFKVWPWGIGAFGDGGTGDVFRDQTNIGAEIGRCDGLEGKLALFQAGLLLNANAAAGGGTPRHLDAVHLDSGGAWLKCESGQIDIDYLYFTRNDGTNNAAIRVEGGIVRIGSIHGSSADADTNSVEVAGGTLAINGGRLRNTGVGARTAYVGPGTGVLKIRNTELPSPGTRTQPIIRADGGEIYIQDNDVPTADAGTGDFIFCAVGTVTGKVGGNRLNGRTLNLGTALIGEVDQSYSGYVSADATTTVRLPAGWTASKAGTGNYIITHTLGWPQSRQAITLTPQNNATDASAVVDQTNTTTNALRIRTYSAGAAADLPFTFTIAHS